MLWTRASLGDYSGEEQLGIASGRVAGYTEYKHRSLALINEDAALSTQSVSHSSHSSQCVLSLAPKRDGTWWWWSLAEMNQFAHQLSPCGKVNSLSELLAAS